MNLQIGILFITLLMMLGGFISNRYRYDVVAVTGLIFLVVVGVIEPQKAFLGFASPAVITVFCIMILTFAINESGVTDWIVHKVVPEGTISYYYIFVICSTTAFLSAFMNNIGALALMMPVAISSCRKSKQSPSIVLMPLAFASVIGGMTTGIGTPPNLLISSYRAKAVGHPFQMFDFSPVGLSVAVCIIFFISLLGWKFLPKEREAKGEDGAFDIEDYITEVSIQKDSEAVGLTVKELEEKANVDFTILGIIRGKQKRLAVIPTEVLAAKDILIIEASSDELKSVLKVKGLELVSYDESAKELLKGKDVILLEAVVPQGGRMEGRSWQKARLKSRYKMNLIAIAREGKPFRNRLNHVNLQAGDVLLIQGETDNIYDTLQQFGMLPLNERNLSIGMNTSAFLPIAIFLIAIVLAAFQILPIQITFAAAIIACIYFGLLPVHRMYHLVDWSVVMLLGAMIPIGQALQTTGATQLLSEHLYHYLGDKPSIVAIALLQVITMSLSDIMNNAATAVIMAPIAVSVANQMNLSADPFLMSVAIGASCSFLTPVSHQNNTLVMGPGGYKFSDYMRLGLPVEILVLLVSVPMIMKFWPPGG